MSPTVYAPVNTAFTPPATRGAQAVDYLDYVITGRPLPESMVPRAYVPPAVATVAEGIERTLVGSAVPNVR